MSNILTQRTITGITTFVLTRQCLFYKIFTLIYDFINPFSFSCQFVIITHYYINDASTEARQTSVLWQLYQSFGKRRWMNILYKLNKLPP